MNNKNLSKIEPSNIFIKQSELKREERKIKKEDLIKIIPSSCLNKEDINLQKNMTEWRWRIYEIEEKIFTEISMMEVNKKRLYFTKYEKWVEENIDPKYDKNIKKQYYYYTI